MTTACCRINAVVAEVGSSAIELAEVEFDGPWNNFAGGSTLTFGSVEYRETGLEEVTATRFSGTLSQYRDLREAEPYTHDSKKECEKARGEICLLDPVSERAFQLAEALGF